MICCDGRTSLNDFTSFFVFSAICMVVWNSVGVCLVDVFFCAVSQFTKYTTGGGWGGESIATGVFQNEIRNDPPGGGL